MPVTDQDSKGESRKAYKITRNGFIYLAMGFTGKHTKYGKLSPAPL